MIDLQAEAEKLRGKDWETFCGLVDTICQEPDNPTPKLVLADWLDEKEEADWSGEGLRWAAEYRKSPWDTSSRDWHRDRTSWLWSFSDARQEPDDDAASLPMIFYDGPNRRDAPFMSWPMDLRLDSPQAAWLWLAVRFGQLLKESAI